MTPIAHRRRSLLTSNRSSIRVRPARPGDGERLAAIWVENARYYVRLFPDDFRIPDVEGLAESLDRSFSDRDENRVRLVAEVDDVVAAYVSGHLEPPDEHADWQMLPDRGRTRLRVDSLGTADAYQRLGCATRLVEAVEAWGRERGATVVSAGTYFASPVSIPFWEQRMGYRRRMVDLTKRLD